MLPTALLAAVPGYTTLDAATARARFDRGEFAVLLDVRTEAEWDEGHLPNATSAPSLHVTADLSPVDGCAACAVAVYCRSGSRSKAAAEELERAGFTTVMDVLGVQQWVAAGAQLVHGESVVPACARSGAPSCTPPPPLRPPSLPPHTTPIHSEAGSLEATSAPDAQRTLGIVLGCALPALTLAAAAVVWLRRRRRARAQKPTISLSVHQPEVASVSSADRA
jgi:rhodanese-related sulfurtransferase